MLYVVFLTIFGSECFSLNLPLNLSIIQKYNGVNNKMFLFYCYRERKTDDEWITLNKIKLPILLNYAQVKLVQEDFYAVIEHCNTILEYDKGEESNSYYFPVYNVTNKFNKTLKLIYLIA